MPDKSIDWERVRRAARALPGLKDELEESTCYGAPALKLRGELVACIPTHKSAEPGSLAVRIDPDSRAEMLEAAPEVYYAPDHYRDSPIVLVRLRHIDQDVLRDLLQTGVKFVAAGKARKRARR